MRAQRAYEKNSHASLTGSWISSAADRVDLGSWVLSEDWILDLGHPRQAGSWILAGGLKNRVRGIMDGLPGKELRGDKTAVLPTPRPQGSEPP